jgi:hypothetical protein
MNRRTVMPIQKVFAHVSCSNLEQSKQWYATLFGRPPDAEPMQHLAEWHHGDNAGMQLFENASASGKSTLTLIVSALREEHRRLALRVERRSASPDSATRTGIWSFLPSQATPRKVDIGSLNPLRKWEKSVRAPGCILLK